MNKKLKAIIYPIFPRSLIRSWIFYPLMIIGIPLFLLNSIDAELKEISTSIMTTFGISEIIPNVSPNGQYDASYLLSLGFAYLFGFASLFTNCELEVIFAQQSSTSGLKRIMIFAFCILILVYPYVSNTITSTHPSGYSAVIFDLVRGNRIATFLFLSSIYATTIACIIWVAAEIRRTINGVVKCKYQ